MGIGMALGPILSSFVYDYLGYRGTFFFYAGFIIFLGLSSAFFIPTRVDNIVEKKE